MGSPACGYPQGSEQGGPCQHVPHSNAIVAVERARGVAARAQDAQVARVAGVVQIVLGDRVRVGWVGRFAGGCGRVVRFERVVGEGVWSRWGCEIGLRWGVEWVA